MGRAQETGQGYASAWSGHDRIIEDQDGIEDSG